MSEFFEPTDRGEHRQDCLDHHAPVPGAALARFHVGWIARLRVEAGVGHDHHVFLNITDHAMERRVRHVRARIIPGHNHAIVVEDIDERGAHNPAMV